MMVEAQEEQITGNEAATSLLRVCSLRTAAAAAAAICLFKACQIRHMRLSLATPGKELEEERHRPTSLLLKFHFGSSNTYTHARTHAPTHTFATGCARIKK